MLPFLFKLFVQEVIDVFAKGEKRKNIENCFRSVNLLYYFLTLRLRETENSSNQRKAETFVYSTCTPFLKCNSLKRTYIKVLCLCHRNLAEQLPRSQTENVIISMHMGNVIYKNLDLQNIHFSLLFAQFSFKALIG